MTHAEKIQQAHEFNLDAAYREIESREMQGEDMSDYYVDETTYAIIKSVKTNHPYGVRMFTGEFAMQMLGI
jgi:hypothetical protein